MLAFNFTNYEVNFFNYEFALARVYLKISTLSKLPFQNGGFLMLYKHNFSQFVRSQVITTKRFVETNCYSVKKSLVKNEDKDRLMLMGVSEITCILSGTLHIGRTEELKEAIKDIRSGCNGWMVAYSMTRVMTNVMRILENCIHHLPHVIFYK